MEKVLIMKKMYETPCAHTVAMATTGHLMLGSRGEAMTIANEEASYDEVGEVKKFTNPDLWADDDE